MRRGRVGPVIASLLLCAGCTFGTPRAAPPVPSVSPTPQPKPTPTPTLVLATYGGDDVAWPNLKHPIPAPPTLGAILTTGRVMLDSGRAFPAGLSLPRIGGTATSPLVLTPCNHRVRITGGAFRAVAPAAPGETLVVLDPGHGGHEPGAVAKDGTREATRNLQLSLAVRDALDGHVDRVVLTRTMDRDTSLAFRVALADALRAGLTVSLHLNAVPDGPSDHPGTSTFASLAEKNGRRAAGVLFQAERRYLETLTPELRGKWVANRDAGALYRIGSRGDFYYQLRNSHVPWVISEALYISNPAEAALIARPDVRAGLAHAIAGGIVEYFGAKDPGSGWRRPLPRPSGPAGGEIPCAEPSA
ncbi:MAG: N-acetylmuramoyl-L-alanine amidase [Actinomycetota bacterium]|nr:N-acetylmuramoyl-L-alanine amidase [Actinomycetota bacterium]